MKAELVNPFVTAAFGVLEQVLGNRPRKGNFEAQRTILASQECNVILGVTGHVQGQILYGMTLATAKAAASTMIGETVKDFDQLAVSAVGELANMISGHAMQHIHTAGFVCDITPPTIICGANIRVDTISIPAVVIPLTVSQGLITVTVGLQECK
jgi:chemotaxis protein CheX